MRSMAVGQIQLERYLFTLEEYERMIEAGVFNEAARVELIRGEIVDMAPINFPHEACVARLTRLLTVLTDGKAYVWPQNNSIRMPGHSRPQPDLTLLKWRDDLYANTPPVGEDVLLVIEVSDTSLKYDRSVKGPLYAEAGIPEYWIVNLRERIIEVYTDPTEGNYQSTRKAKSGEMLPLSGGLGSDVKVADVLGEIDAQR